MRHTAEFLSDLVPRHKSVSSILRELGLKPAGGSHRRITSLIRSYGISTAHFERPKHIPSSRRQPEDLLVLHQSPLKRVNGIQIRRALLETGVPELCGICGMGPEWMGSPLRLQIDHKDGCSHNNEPENLRFLCPNCHSQTPTFGSRNFVRKNNAVCSLASCQKPFWASYKIRKRAKGPFCSTDCYRTSRRIKEDELSTGDRPAR